MGVLSVYIRIDRIDRDDLMIEALNMRVRVIGGSFEGRKYQSESDDRRIDKEDSDLQRIDRYSLFIG